MVTEIAMASIVVASREAISTELDNEVVILDTDKGVYFGLDAVGALIWSSIQAPAALSEVRDRVLNEYAVDAAVCEADLLRLIRDLHSHRLVIVDDPK